MDKINVDDIQDLIIQKKFVRINSDNYTSDAYAYVKQLIDNERAILFDADTHRIYTLGQYYGGDELKENLLYFSKILSVDINDNILDEIDAIQNSDTLALKGKDALKVNIYKDKQYPTIEFEYSLDNAIDNTIFNFKQDAEYHLYINENGQIALHEYIYPKIIVENPEPIDINEDITKKIKFSVVSSIDIANWEIFDVSSNCEILEIDLENQTVEIEFPNHIDGIVRFIYNDGKTQDEYEFIQKRFHYCKCGLYDSRNYVEYNSIQFVDCDVPNITIDQQQKYNAYVILPIHINPIFIDNNTKMQGAWHKVYNLPNVNYNKYNLYMTDNSGLGNIEWKIINKKI